MVYTIKVLRCSCIDSPMQFIQTTLMRTLCKLRITWTAVKISRNAAVNIKYGWCFIACFCPLKKGTFLSGIRVYGSIMGGIYTTLFIWGCRLNGENRHTEILKSFNYAHQLFLSLQRTGKGCRQGRCLLSAQPQSCRLFSLKTMVREDFNQMTEVKKHIIKTVVLEGDTTDYALNTEKRGYPLEHCKLNAPGADLYLTKAQTCLGSSFSLLCSYDFAFILPPACEWLLV